MYVYINICTCVHVYTLIREGVRTETTQPPSSHAYMYVHKKIYVHVYVFPRSFVMSSIICEGSRTETTQPPCSNADCPWLHCLQLKTSWGYARNPPFSSTLACTHFPEAHHPRFWWPFACIRLCELGKETSLLANVTSLPANVTSLPAKVTSFPEKVASLTAFCAFALKLPICSLLTRILLAIHLARALFTILYATSLFCASTHSHTQHTRTSVCVQKYSHTTRTRTHIQHAHKHLYTHIYIRTIVHPWTHGHTAQHSLSLTL